MPPSGTSHKSFTFYDDEKEGWGRQEDDGGSGFTGDFTDHARLPTRQERDVFFGTEEEHVDSALPM